MSVVSFLVQPRWSDQSLLLYDASRLLAGAKLTFAGLVEENPPLIIWLSEIPVMLGHAIGISPQLALRLCAAVLIALSVAWCVAIVSPHHFIILAAVETLIACRCRSLRSMIRPETAALGITGLAYGVAIWLWALDYILKVVPLALATYFDYAQVPLLELILAVRGEDRRAHRAVGPAVFPLAPSERQFDIERWRPNPVLVNRCDDETIAPCLTLERFRVSVLEWLKRDAGFAAAWSGYVPLGRVGPYDVWCLRDDDAICRRALTALQRAPAAVEEQHSLVLAPRSGGNVIAPSRSGP